MYRHTDNTKRVRVRHSVIDFPNRFPDNEVQNGPVRTFYNTTCCNDIPRPIVLCVQRGILKRARRAIRRFTIERRAGFSLEYIVRRIVDCTEY